MDVDTIIIGGGMAGLACATELEARGADWLLVEAAPRVGGRVATDRVDGFQLDRGFQVLLTAYPEAKRIFDYPALDLAEFASGARVYAQDRWYSIADPLREPGTLLATLSTAVTTLPDKWRTLRWRQKVTSTSVDELLRIEERSALEELHSLGFSQPSIDLFWRPFFAGIFLDPSLQRSNRLLHFVFKMFSEGRAALPAQGMVALADQLAARLPAARLMTGQQVDALDGTAVRTAQGHTLRARTLVLATDFATARKWVPDLPALNGLAVKCDYFSCAELPKHARFLHLCPQGPINNIAFPSAIQASYAPPGRHLISVSHFSAAPIQEIQQHLIHLFGKSAHEWQHLQRYDIPHALPDRNHLTPPHLPLQLHKHLYLAGDHRGLPSLNSALATGTSVAKSILARRM